MAKTVFYFKGDEKYLTQSKIKRLIKESKANDLNITTYDCSEMNIEKAVFDILTPAFLGDKKVVIVKNPSFLESEKNHINHNTKLLIQYLENQIEDNYLIVNASGVKVNEKLDVSKALTKFSNVIVTNGISEVEFSGWLTRECEIQNVSIERNAISLYYKACNNNLELAKNEIDKAINYVSKNGRITEEIALELISKSTTNDIFSLTNAIFERNTKKIMEVYFELTRYEKDVTILINMITKSLKDNLLVKMMVEMGLEQNELAQKMKVSPNRAYYMIKNSNNFSIEDVKKIIEKLSLLDYQIKSGKKEKKIGFEEFLLSL